MRVNYTRIAIGDARREGREPSHDGEYLTLAQDDQGRWLLEDNSGIIGTVYGDTYLQACGDEASEEDESIQAEIDQWLALADPLPNTPMAAQDAANLRRALGLQARDIAREWGWPLDEE